MIKLIVSDIDGTLVPEGTNTLDPDFYHLICRLRSKGVYFTIASGRHISSIRKMFTPVKDDIFYITSNGSYIGTFHKTLSISEIPTDIWTDLAEDFDMHIHLPYLAETPDAAYTPCDDPEFIRLLREDYGYDIHHCSSLKDISEPIIKMTLYHPENVSKIDNIWLQKWNKTSKAVISGTHWIDFMNKETNKGNALAHLQEVLGINIQETLAFGDQINDIEMLKQAYFSFAVDNACPTVKNAARFVCDSCANSGVMHTISSFFSTNH